MKYRVWVFSSISRRFVPLHDFTSEGAAKSFRFFWQMRRMATAVEKVPELCGICRMAEGDWTDTLGRYHDPKRRICPGPSRAPEPIEVCA